MYFINCIKLFKKLFILWNSITSKEILYDTVKGESHITNISYLLSINDNLIVKDYCWELIIFKELYFFILGLGTESIFL